MISREKLIGIFLGMTLMISNAEVSEKKDTLAVLTKLKLDSGMITSMERVTSSTLVASDSRVVDNVPPRTVVKITLNPAKRSNINIEIWLPDSEKWNSRFVGIGNGGSAGHIKPEIFVGSLRSGYATATTDMGTAPNPDSGIANPEVWKDFGFRATHLMTVAAKQVIQAYYGKAPDYSYFSGGSTGGQQALQEAQRYPDDYDGIVANIPAHCRTPLHAYFLWNEQILKKCPFTESQQNNIVAAGNEYMASRENPVTAGKIVSDPRCNSKDIDEVINLALKKDPTLTQEHAEALRKLFDGPKHSMTGERIFCGIPLGCNFKNAHGNLYLFHWVFGKDKDLMTIDFGKDFDTYTAALGPYLNAENPNLKKFAERGGKLIMMSGSADPCVPYHATLDYYEQVIELFGGDIEKVKSFFKYYIIPGMNHGMNESPGINNLPSSLPMVVDWREKGVSPEEIRGRRIVNGKTEMDIPIYPYPAKAQWDAQAQTFKPVDGLRGGVERVSRQFKPSPSE